MSDMKNKFGDNVSWFCYEGAISLDDLKEDDGSLPDEFEVIGEDGQGREGSCTIGVIELLESAHAEMESMKKQLASQISASTKANHLRVKDLERLVSVMGGEPMEQELISKDENGDFYWRCSGDLLKDK